MKMLRTLAVAFVGTASIPAVAQAWDRSTGSPYSSATAAALDPLGNVVAGGSIKNQFAVTKLATGNGATLWKQRVHVSDAPSGGFVHAVATDSVGDVLCTGEFAFNNPLATQFAIVKLSGTAGTEVWRRTYDDTVSTFADGYAVAADSAGDVIAGGSAGAFTVVKLAGATGSELWRYDTNGSHAGVFNQALALAIDAAGDVIAAGQLSEVTTDWDLFVVKLSGMTGGELWRQQYAGTADQLDRANAVGVDANGDVIVGGVVKTVPNDCFVAKFSGATGMEMWRWEDGASCLGTAIDGNGDVVTAGYAGGPNAVVFVAKLSSATGLEQWRAQRDFGPGAWDSAASVRVDPAGDVVAGGQVQGGKFALFKFSGTTGADLWRYELNRSGITFRAAAVVLDTAGNAFGVGQAGRSGGQFTVVKASEKLSGRFLDVHATPGSASTARLRVTSKDRGVLASAPGGSADPRFTGAVLELINPTTGETESISLPGVNWDLGSPPARPVRYSYHDGSNAPGTCATLKLETGRGLRASCRTASFTLDEATQGSLAVRLTVGGARYCALFGGSVASDAPGAFMAENAPVPLVCPGP